MDDAQALLHTLTVIGMILTLLVSIIPFISGPIFMWLLALAFTLLTGRVSPAAFVILTMLMIVGTTTEYWLPLIGIRMPGLSCMSALGSLIGGLLGTFLIPVPILGTIIGMVTGAMLLELLRLRQWREMLQAGKAALKLYLWGVVIEFGFSLTMLLVFVAST
jgi:uncharacterized protein YqgC (DUF456 family)